MAPLVDRTDLPADYYGGTTQLQVKHAVMVEAQKAM
jgi:hypothetical protein